MKVYHKVATYLGSTIVTLLLIPEIMTVVRNKSAHDLSYLFLSMHAIMAIFFVIFANGIHQDSGLTAALPGYISNTVSFIFSIILIYLKHHYEKNKKTKSS